MKHSKTRRPQQGLTHIIAITIALSASGCHVNGPYDPTPPTEAAKALQALKSLPSLEDEQAKLQAVIDQIASAASALVPGITWTTDNDTSSAECDHPYDQSPGVSRYLPDRIAADVAISEQQWAEIQHAAQQAAAALQATESQVMRDSPGSHDIGFYGPAGLFVKVSYRGNLVVAGYTGCRLPREHT